MLDEGQAQRTLAGVVGDGVGHQINVQLIRDLFHDLGFADARRAHQQNGPLAHGGNAIGAEFVLGQVGAHRVDDFLFGSFDVHSIMLLVWAGWWLR